MKCHIRRLGHLYVLKLLSCNSRDILHKYANEDVSLGAWFLGLDVDQIDERRMCCGTPPGNSNL